MGAAARTTSRCIYSLCTTGKLSTVNLARVWPIPTARPIRYTCSASCLSSNIARHRSRYEIRALCHCLPGCVRAAGCGVPGRVGRVRPGGADRPDRRIPPRHRPGRDPRRPARARLGRPDHRRRRRPIRLSRSRRVGQGRPRPRAGRPVGFRQGGLRGLGERLLRGQAPRGRQDVLLGRPNVVANRQAQRMVGRHGVHDGQARQGLPDVAIPARPDDRRAGGRDETRRRTFPHRLRQGGVRLPSTDARRARRRRADRPLRRARRARRRQPQARRNRPLLPRGPAAQERPARIRYPRAARREKHGRPGRPDPQDHRRDRAVPLRRAGELPRQAHREDGPAGLRALPVRRRRVGVPLVEQGAQRRLGPVQVHDEGHQLRRRVRRRRPRTHPLRGRRVHQPARLLRRRPRLLHRPLHRTSTCSSTRPGRRNGRSTPC